LHKELARLRTEVKDTEQDAPDSISSDRAKER
jgi:hypothetical protein